MYVALRELNLGEGRRAMPGDPVPDANAWGAVILRAHLNLGWIKWVDVVTKFEQPAIEAAPDGGVVEAEQTAPTEYPASPGFPCTECGRKDFGSKRAVSNHRARAHAQRQAG